MYHPNSQFRTTRERSMARAAERRVSSRVLLTQLDEPFEIKFPAHCVIPIRSPNLPHVYPLCSYRSETVPPCQTSDLRHHKRRRKSCALPLASGEAQSHASICVVNAIDQPISLWQKSRCIRPAMQLRLMAGIYADIAALCWTVRGERRTIFRLGSLGALATRCHAIGFSGQPCEVQYHVFTHRRPGT